MNDEASRDWQTRLVALIKKYSGPHHRDFSTDTSGKGNTVTMTNAACGDSVTVFRDERDRGRDEGDDQGPVHQGPVRVRARGCSLCKASAALGEGLISRLPAQAVSEVVPGVCGTMIALIHGEIDQDCEFPEDVPADLADDLRALGVLRHVPARSRCGVLAWESLAEFLHRYPQPPSGAAHG
jgi:NifU-like protein involved in Fe-S cluster formation